MTSSAPRSPFPDQLKSLRESNSFIGWSSVALRLRTRKRAHTFTEAHSFWICTRFAIGTTLLLAMVILTPSYSNKKFLGGKDADIAVPNLPPNFLQFSIPAVRIAKTAAWTYLGFLTTFICTMEGTMKRGVLRMIGVVCGSGMAWLCLLAFPHSGIAQCIWMVVTDFIVVWISVNPNSPFGGFHPSWGYSAQLFTYQQAIIVCETTILAPKYERNEITVDRFISQSIGIATAVLLSLIVFPSRAGPTVRLYLSDAVYSMSQTTQALIELYCVPKQTYTLDSDTVERRNLDAWLHHYKKYSASLDHDLETANRFRLDNAILAGFAPLKNHPALDVIYSCFQRHAVIRGEAHETLRSLWSAAETTSGSDKGAPDSARKLELSSHTISIYADEPTKLNSGEDSEYPSAWQTPPQDHLSSPKDSRAAASFQPSPVHRATPPEDRERDRFLQPSLPSLNERARSSNVERMVTPVSAHFSIPYDMTSCGVQTAETRAHLEEAPVLTPSISAAPSRQPSLSTLERSAGKAVLAERDAATRETERLREENERQRADAEILNERIRRLEEEQAAAPIMLTRAEPAAAPRVKPRLGAAPRLTGEVETETDLSGMLDRLTEARVWLREEGDDERYAASLAAIMLVFERLYVIVENGLQWGGRKARSSFPMLSSEFGEACEKALSWLREMLLQVSSRAATEIALIDPEVSTAHRPSELSPSDLYKEYCSRLEGAPSEDDSRQPRILEVALRMRALSHFLFLETMELSRLVNLITNELWDKGRIRSSKTVTSRRL